MYRGYNNLQIIATVKWSNTRIKLPQKSREILEQKKFKKNVMVKIFPWSRKDIKSQFQEGI